MSDPQVLVDVANRNTLARSYIGQGWALCHIPHGSKGPEYSGWNDPANALTVENIDRLPDDRNIGLMHSLSGTCAIDIDHLERATAWFAERGIDLQALLDAPDAVRIISGRPGSDKLLYALPSFMAMRSKKITNEVDGKRRAILEFRCASKEGKSLQDVLPPAVHERGTIYQWAGKGNWQNLPVLPSSLMEAWQQLLDDDQRQAAAVGNNPMAPSWGELAAALNAIDPDCDRDTWIESGMALQVAGEQLGRQDEAFALWNEWSSKGTKYKPDEMNSQWKSFKPTAGGITPATLFFHAVEYGWKRPPPDVTEMFKSANMLIELKNTAEADERLLLAELPSFPESALYGPVGEFAKAAAAGSEATVQSVYTLSLSYLSAMVAACFCVEIGFERVPLTESVLAIGPSGKGRKGTAGSLAKDGLAPPLQALASASRDSVGMVEKQRADAQAAIDELTSAIELQQFGFELLTTGKGVAEQLAQLEDKEKEIAHLTTAIGKCESSLHKHMDSPTSYKRHTKHLQTLRGQLEQAEATATPLRHFRTVKENFDEYPDEYHERHQANMTNLNNGIAMHTAILEGLSNAPKWSPLHRIGKPLQVRSALSSGEGLVDMIADVREKPNGVIVGTNDKRILLNLTEFGATLKVMGRDSNTASAMLRDAIDGVTIETTGKTDPCRATDPHLAVAAHITIAEYMALTHNDRRSTEAVNGLLNRFLPIYTNRQQLVPIPERVPHVESFAAAIWSNLERVFADLHPADGIRTTAIEFTPEGREAWIAGYAELSSMTCSSAAATAMMQRAEWHARKLSALLAILNGESRVSKPAVDAAIALVGYAQKSADKVASNYEARVAFAKIKADGERILTKLSDELQVASVLRNEMKMERDDFENGVRYLTEVCSPPKAVIEVVEQNSGNAGGMKKVAKIRCNKIC